MRLMSATDRTRFDADVISMMPTGITGERIREMGFPVRSLDMSRNFPNPAAFFRLAAWLRSDPPDVLATWMYHANFLGSLVAPLAGGIPVVWGLHHGHIDAFERRRTHLIARLCGRMSHRMAAKVICCSQHTREEHELLGYDPAKMVVIRNGFDLTVFRPDRSARPQVRRELGIEENAPVLFLAGRFHPQKDYPNFVAAAALVHRRLPAARFVLCGHGVTWENQALAGWIDAAGLRESFRLLGSRHDVPQLLNAVDVACSSSFGEGFSLTIGEAMSCGVPCVVTDVGDSAFEVGQTGRIVPRSNPKALAAACVELLEMPAEERLDLGRRARRRIEDNFQLSHVTAQYQELYESVAFAAKSSGTGDRAPAAGLPQKSEILR